MTMETGEPSSVAVGIPVEAPAPQQMPYRGTSTSARTREQPSFPSDCCCACASCWAAQPFFLLSAIKGIIGAALISPVTCAAFFLISILMWPHDIGYTCVAVARTKLLGPNLKALSLLLLPVPLLLWPILAAVGGLFAGAGAGFFGPAELPRNSRHMCMGVMCLYSCSARLPISGFEDAVKEAGKILRGFWHFMKHSYFTYLRELIDYDGEPFDIRLLQLFVCLLVAPFGGLLCCVGYILMLWKLPLALLRVEFEVLDAFCKSSWSCFELLLFVIPWLVALVAAPAGVVILAAVAPVGAFLFGFVSSGITAYQARTILGMFPAGLSMAYYGVRAGDEGTNEFLFDKEVGSCLPKWEYKDKIFEGPSKENRKRRRNAPGSGTGHSDDQTSGAGAPSGYDPEMAVGQQTGGEGLEGAAEGARVDGGSGDQGGGERMADAGAGAAGDQATGQSATDGFEAANSSGSGGAAAAAPEVVVLVDSARQAVPAGQQAVPAGQQAVPAGQQADEAGVAGVDKGAAEQ